MKKIIYFILTIYLISGCSQSEKVVVNGLSMEPTLKQGDICTLEKTERIERFDIVVFEIDGHKNIKRVIGLPNEKIEYKDNELFVNDEKIPEPDTYNHETEDFSENIIDDCYYVLGDNRKYSKDSRMTGCVPKSAIVGTCKE